MAPAGGKEPRCGGEEAGFAALLSRHDLLRIFSVGAAAFGAFSSVFNYLPFHLAGPPFLLLIPVAAGLLEARADRPGLDFPLPGPA